MKFIIEQTVINQFPNTVIGILVANNVNNQADSSSISNIARAEEKRIRSQFDIETLTQNEGILVWREAYKKFGAKSEYRSSVENLYRLVLKGNELRNINPLVDIYNYISLKYMLPVGGEDIDSLSGDLKLTVAGENEISGLLLGELELRDIPAGEVLYKDDKGMVCRRWNWKEAERTKLTDDTKRAVLVIEGLGNNVITQVQSATEETAKLIESICHVRTSTTILSKDKFESDLLRS